MQRIFLMLATISAIFALLPMEAMPGLVVVDSQGASTDGGPVNSKVTYQSVDYESGNQINYVFDSFGVGAVASNSQQFEVENGVLSFATEAQTEGGGAFQVEEKAGMVSVFENGYFGGAAGLFIGAANAAQIATEAQLTEAGIAYQNSMSGTGRAESHVFGAFQSFSTEEVPHTEEGQQPEQIFILAVDDKYESRWAFGRIFGTEQYSFEAVRALIIGAPETVDETTEPEADSGTGEKTE